MDLYARIKEHTRILREITQELREIRQGLTEVEKVITTPEEAESNISDDPHVTDPYRPSAFDAEGGSD